MGSGGQCRLGFNGVKPPEHRQPLLLIAVITAHGISVVQTLKNNTEVTESEATSSDSAPTVQREISTQTPTPVSSVV